MLPYPNIRPEIVQFGPLAIRWYGLMYVCGFVVGFQLCKRQAQKGLLKLSYRGIESFITHLVIGMLIGSRLTYALVYNWDYYSVHPFDVFKIWHGGLSFHGAAIGMCGACIYFARKMKLPVYMLTDTLALCSTPGLAFGRLGNFINAELYGRPTDLPWAMIFPTDPSHMPRHPSQLYEALTEGLFLFLFLNGLQRLALRKGFYRVGLIGPCFLMAYGVLRFLVEFTRQPDSQLGFVWGSFSMGQLLCALTFILGAVTFWHHRYLQPKPSMPTPPSEAFLKS